MDDLISRQAAIDALDEIESEVADGYGYQYEKWRKYFCGLPSAQPEIIRCEDCMHNGSFDTDCPISWNGKEYCSFAERRTDDRSD